MSLLNMLMNAQNGNGLATLADQFGVPQDKVSAIADMLAPTVGAAAKEQANSGNLDSLLGTLQGEGAAHFLEDPTAAADGAGRDQGAAFLRNLMGSAEGTEALAQEAADRAGVEPGQAQDIMSALGAMLQGGMQQQMPDDAIANLLGGGSDGGGSGGIMGMISGLLGGGGQSGGESPLAMLNNMLDADGDGSAVDDILGKILKR
mgnify:CR=1 FL=1